MRTELFSVRQSAEELSLLNRDLRKIVTALNEKASLRVLFKTEIDCNPKKIKNDLIYSLISDNPPELYIYANALDSTDSSSFQRIFGPLIKRLEKELDAETLDEDGKTKLYPHIKVHTLEGLPGGYPGYCFVIRNKKIIVLPRISLVGGDLSDYLCTAVNIAKDIFKKAFEEGCEGYVLLPKQKKKNFTPQNMQTSATAESTQTTEAELPIDTVAETKLPADATEYTDTTKAEASSDTPQTSQNSTEKPDTASQETEEKAAAKGFFKSFIPMKGDSIKTIITKSVVLVAIASFLVAAYMLLDFYVIKPWQNTVVIDEIKQVFYSEEEVTVTESSGDEIITKTYSKNWKGLKKINEEIVAWIKIDNTEIDFPVLFHPEDNEDGQFYLYRNYKKEPSDFGSIFLDYRCVKGTDSKQIVLHGHNMSSDGSMFTTLLDYSRKDGWTKGNTDYYKKAPIISLATPDGDRDYVIFAVMKINVSNDNDAIFNYLMGDFESDAQFMNYVYNVKERSYLDVDVPINENDKLLTLSTCSYEQENNRTVIVGRQLREDEKADKYIKSVKEGTPVTTVASTFSKQYIDGNITWYDGDGNLEGSEDMEYLAQTPTYKVRFLDSKGKTFGKVQTIMEGEDAIPPDMAPVKAPDGTHYYVFSKWDKSFENVTKDLTIKPIYTKHKLENPVTTVATTKAPAPENDKVEEDKKPAATKAPDPTEAPTNVPTEAVTDPPATTAAPQTTSPADPTETTAP